MSRIYVLHRKVSTFFAYDASFDGLNVVKIKNTHYYIRTGHFDFVIRRKCRTFALAKTPGVFLSGQIWLLATTKKNAKKQPYGIARHLGAFPQGLI